MLAAAASTTAWRGEERTGAARSAMPDGGAARVPLRTVQPSGTRDRAAARLPDVRLTGAAQELALQLL